jgi:hypothetical protein
VIVAVTAIEWQKALAHPRWANREPTPTAYLCEHHAARALAASLAVAAPDLPTNCAWTEAQGRG